MNSTRRVTYLVFDVVPGPPMSLVLESPSETEMTLHWKPPDQPNGILFGYTLHYQQSENGSTAIPSNIQHEVYDLFFNERSIYKADDTTQSITATLEKCQKHNPVMMLISQWHVT